MEYGIAAVLGYLLGSANLALLISKLRGIDLQKHGSGNLGASNTTIIIGWRYGVLVAVHDIGKAWLAVFLAKLLLPQAQYAAVLAGVCCVLGHMFPFYNRFQGGKGLAAYLGMTLALDWRIGLVSLVLLVAATVITDYIVVGTTVVILAVPVGVWLVDRNWIPSAILAIATAVMLLKHRKNYIRIARGTEVGLRRTMRGKDRVR